MQDKKLLQRRQGWAVSEFDRLRARSWFFDGSQTREEIAAAIKCSYMTVRNILKDGKLKGYERDRLTELESAQEGAA